jgi:hypothetical protein
MHGMRPEFMMTFNDAPPLNRWAFQTVGIVRGRVTEAYDRMMSAKARFRVVLTIGG